MSLLLLDTTFLIDAERGGVDLDDAIDDDDDVCEYCDIEMMMICDFGF